jgi:hypothetical protein
MVFLSLGNKRRERERERERERVVRERGKQTQAKKIHLCLNSND